LGGHFGEFFAGVLLCWGAFLLGWHREKKFVTFEKISSSKRGGVRTAFGGTCYDNGLG